MRLIGISGKAGTGKDTFALGLMKQGFVRHCFADPLKKMLNEYYFLGLHDYYGPKTAFQRTALTLGGTEHGRCFWEDLTTKHPEILEELHFLGYKHPEHLWLLHLEKTLNEIKEPYAAVLVSDVRFPDEAQFIRDRGGCLIRMERKGIKKVDHISETALDDFDGWDYIVNNNSNREDILQAGRAFGSLDPEYLTKQPRTRCYSCGSESFWDKKTKAETIIDGGTIIALDF